MAIRIEFDQAARVELFATRDWIAEKYPGRAEEWFAGLLARIESLEIFPRRCPVAPEGRRLGLKVRELHYGKRKRGVQRILFVVEGNLVRILSIKHSSRNGRDL